MLSQKNTSSQNSYAKNQKTFSVSSEKESFDAKHFNEIYFAEHKSSPLHFAELKCMQKVKKTYIFDKQSAGIKAFIQNYFQKTR